MYYAQLYFVLFRLLGESVQNHSLENYYIKFGQIVSLTSSNPLNTIHKIVLSRKWTDKLLYKIGRELTTN